MYVYEFSLKAGLLHCSYNALTSPSSVHFIFCILAPHHLTITFMLDNCFSCFVPHIPTSPTSRLPSGVCDRFPSHMHTLLLPLKHTSPCPAPYLLSADLPSASPSWGLEDRDEGRVWGTNLTQKKKQQRRWKALQRRKKCGFTINKARQIYSNFANCF